MKMMFVVALALVAAAAAAPQGSPVAASASASVGASAPTGKPVEILRSTFDQQPEGGYAFDFETSDGSSRDETGELKEVVDEENKPHSVVVVRGRYSYTDDTGNVQSITYYADETGFHAEGDAIPKASR